MTVDGTLTFCPHLPPPLSVVSRVHATQHLHIESLSLCFWGSLLLKGLTYQGRVNHKGKGNSRLNMTVGECRREEKVKS